MPPKRSTGRDVCLQGFLGLLDILAESSYFFANGPVANAGVVAYYAAP